MERVELSNITDAMQNNAKPFWVNSHSQSICFLFQCLLSNKHVRACCYYLYLLELWVNFDHIYCFWAKSLEQILILLMLVQFPSVRYLPECVSPNSVCQLPVTDGRKITEGDRPDGLMDRQIDT